MKLPDERDLGQLPNISGQRAVGTFDATGVARGAAAIGEGVKALGQGEEKLAAGIEAYNLSATNIKLNENRYQYATGKADLTVGKAKLDDTFLEDTDYKTQPDRYREGITKERDRIAEGITSPEMRNRYVIDTDKDIELAVLKQARSAQHGTAKLGLAAGDEKIESIRQYMLLHPDEAPQKLGEVKGLLDSFVANKWIDPVAAQKYVKQFDEKYAIGAVSMLPAPEQIKALQEPTRDKESFLDRTGGVENATGNPRERSKTSSAMGNFQFIDSTWLSTIKNHRPDIANGKSDAALLDLRGSPELSREMAGHLYDENAATFAKAGVDPTPGNMYLAHFAGSQGAIDLLKAPPGTPAIDVLGEKAVNANRSVLAGKTAQDVVAWADGKMGGTVRGQGNPIDYIPEDKRREMLMKAQTSVVTAARQTDSAAAQEQFTVKDLIKSDLASMAGSGQGVDGLTEERVRNALGSGAATEWKQTHEDAHTVFLATSDLTTLNDQQLAERIAQVQPQPGMQDYARQAAIAKAVTDGAHKVLKMRNEDPAGLFNSAPVVQKALQGVDKKNPATWAPVGKARLAEQQAAGVDEDNQTPITKDEAAALAVPLHRMVPGTERATVTQLGNDLHDMFGQDAGKAFIYVMRQVGLGEEARKVAGRVLKDLNLSPEDIARAAAERTAREAADRDAAAKATGGGWFGWLANGVDPDGINPPMPSSAKGDPSVPEPAAKAVNIPKSAIAELRKNPQLAGDFNKKYGNGNDVAKDIIKSFTTGMGRGGEH